MTGNLLASNTRAGIDVNIHVEGFTATGNVITDNHIGVIVHRLTRDVHLHDNEIFNSEMGDLKTWLEQQGIRVD